MSGLVEPSQLNSNVVVSKISFHHNIWSYHLPPYKDGDYGDDHNNNDCDDDGADHYYDGDDEDDLSTGGKVQGELLTPNADEPFLHG